LINSITKRCIEYTAQLIMWWKQTHNLSDEICTVRIRSNKHLQYLHSFNDEIGTVRILSNKHLRYLYSFNYEIGTVKIRSNKLHHSSCEFVSTT
jgi:hypothetical protein